MRVWGIYCGYIVCFCLVNNCQLAAQTAAGKADLQSSTPLAAVNEGDSKVDAPALLIEIADEPVGIDPANFVDPDLAKLATVQFIDSSLTDVAKWIEQQTRLPVILDRRSLEMADILPSEPVEDRLENEPIYLLLDRLSKIGIAWRLDRDIVYLNAIEDQIESTQQFSVGDLFDLGYEPERLQSTIENSIQTDSWEVQGGSGGIVMLGDVMFVRHTQLVRRKVAGLLQALRQHARRTLVFEPPQHAELREALDRPISVRFVGMPLVTVVRQLESLTDSNIYLDATSLEAAGVRDRLPISLELDNQPLRLILDLLRQQYELAWQITDGELVITHPDFVEAKTAVFDVRDLCRNRDESNSLQEAIESQSAQADWLVYGGTGTIEFPIPGTMVIQQDERGLDSVLQLLENYRAALRASKPRERQDTDPLTTRYYRMPSTVAEDLSTALPELLQQKTWKTERQPEAPGTIRVIRSWPESQPADAQFVQGSNEPLAYSVLVIHQRHSVHNEIPALLRKIELGEREQPTASVGGFGGGFFRVK